MSEVETLTNQAGGGGFNPQTAGVQQPASLAKTNVSKKGPLGFFTAIQGQPWNVDEENSDWNCSILCPQNDRVQIGVSNV